jgi:thymidylate synthase
MNNLDLRYQALLEDIMHLGVVKSDRTGTGTISVFGRQIRHKMSEGFPLLTTKKMHWNSVVTELLWFLRGDTNIKFLLDYDCHIWDGDAYKRYITHWGNPIDPINYELYGPNTTMNCFHEDKRLYTKEEFVKQIKTDETFAKQWGDLGPIYGKQWRDWGSQRVSKRFYEKPIPYSKFVMEGGIDQIQNLINELKTNPDSRRLMVSAWNVGELDQMTLPPCHYGFQLYTRELTGEERWDLLKERVGVHKFQLMVDDIVPFGGGLSEELQSYNIPKRAISLMWNQRSVDTFLGLPFNIASYGLLLEIIAKEVNMVPDELIGNLGDVHLYSNHIEQAKEQITREPMKLPELWCLDEYHYLMDEELVGQIPFGEKIEKFRPDFFTIHNYEAHPAIKAPLSN